MLISRKQRKNLSNPQKQSTSRRIPPMGHWYRVRKQGHQRHNNPRIRQLALILDMSDNNAQLETATRGAYYPMAAGLANYYGETSKRIERLTKALFTDVYHVPLAVEDIVLENPSSAERIGEDLYRSVAQFAGYNIFFDNGEIEEKYFLGAGTEGIAEDLYVSRKRIGMPVKAFLLYYRGGEVPKEVISELSGIPSRYIKWAYETLVTYMWGGLSIHRQKERLEAGRRKRPPQSTMVADDISFDEPEDTNGHELRDAIRREIRGRTEDNVGQTDSRRCFKPEPISHSAPPVGDFIADDFSE